MTIDPTQLADDMADGTPGLAVELAQQFGRTLDAYRDHELASEALSANQETQIATLTARAEAAEAENAALRADVADLRVRVAELEAELAALIASLPGIRAAERERCSARIDVQVQIYRRDVPDHERKPNVTYRILRERVDTYQSARDIIRALGDAP